MNDTRRFKKPYTTRRIVSRKDYSSHKTLGANLAELPPELTSVTRILTQTAENCTAYAITAVRESMTGSTYDPEKQWQLELEFLGVEDAPNGVELKIPLAVATKIGFIKEGEATPGDKASAYFFLH